ncbi:response regulator [Conexibacter woesei]|uniref:Response regulator receiver protein n=1 Tax=Conexibacter woesei (strain DSM 14684 / CCUG 47730 / CIP 108061 / JCM 11494 / NBRC 100937 / ID131577) TaxID=469383 RepID=D3F1H3_CONWI|nr:response regulator transcription factor [Conexibacter woesei]ADB52136.1 response regulator receiver protein [Conexibacter woesei DSM 14684]
MALTILIVDDHPSFRSSARRVLEAGGFTVVGEAEDGAGGVAAARDLRPDVVLLDVGLPDADGFDVAGSIKALPDPPDVVIVSSRDSSDFGPLVEASGACGFVSKADLSGEAVAALLP